MSFLCIVPNSHLLFFSWIRIITSLKTNMELMEPNMEFGRCMVPFGKGDFIPCLFSGVYCGMWTKISGDYIDYMQCFTPC